MLFFTPEEFRDFTPAEARKHFLSVSADEVLEQLDAYNKLVLDDKSALSENLVLNASSEELALLYSQLKTVNPNPQVPTFLSVLYHNITSHSLYNLMDDKENKSEAELPSDNGIFSEEASDGPLDCSLLLLNLTSSESSDSGTRTLRPSMPGRYTKKSGGTAELLSGGISFYSSDGVIASSCGTHSCSFFSGSGSVSSASDDGANLASAEHASRRRHSGGASDSFENDSSSSERRASNPF